MTTLPSKQLEKLRQVWHSMARQDMQGHHINHMIGVDHEEYVNAATNGLADPLTPDHQNLLAHGYFKQGRYEEALDMAMSHEKTDPDFVKLIRRYIKARDRDDNEMCKCNHQPFEAELIWSTKHAAWVNLTHCPNCPALNITPNQIRKVIKK